MSHSYRVRFSLPFVFMALLMAAALSGCGCGDALFNRCIPLTCEEAGANCGTIDDGCDGTVNCGYCAAGFLCGEENRCEVDPSHEGRGERTDPLTGCEPYGCAESDSECGTVPDGCAATEICGFCGGGGSCEAGHDPGTCGQSVCEPSTCAALGAECGLVPDGCGGVLDCGFCPEGQSCGTNQPNRCEHGERSCPLPPDCGDACGIISDGCGGVIRCPGCAPDEVCDRGECVLGADAIGEPCTVDQDCDTGYCLSESEKGWHDGYCSSPCSSDSDCGDGNICGFMNSSGTGICLERCENNAGCRINGYVCTIPEGRVENACVPGGTGKGLIADHCQTSADCDGGPKGLCLREEMGFPGGYCTHTCGFQGPCPSGTTCAFDAQERGICVGLCSEDEDCNEGYRCRDIGGGRKGCWPGGDTGDPCNGHADCNSGVCLSQDRHGWPGGYCTDLCDSDQDCADGDLCLPWGPNGQGICVKGCDSDTDCREGYVCTVTPNGERACLPYGGGDGRIGDPCSSTADCDGGTDAVCVPTPSGGQCSTRCSTNGDCPPGYRCVTDGSIQPGFCQLEDLIVDNCSTDGDCPDGEICIDGPTGRTCGTACYDDEDCPDDMICTSDPVFGGPGYCIPGGDGGPGTAGPGSSCTHDYDCYSGICLTEDETGWPGGYCAQPCESDDDCAVGTVCVPGGPAGQNICMPTCQTDRECRQGLVCRYVDGYGPVCAPADGDADEGDPCEDANTCPDGMLCIQTAEGTRCVTTCTDQGDCEDGKVCRPVGDGLGTGICEPGDDSECLSNDDCPEGEVCGIHIPSSTFRCMEEGGGGIDWGIPEDEIFGPTPTGDPCESNLECERLQCFREEETGWKKGYCTGHCSSDTDCTPGSICGLKRKLEITIDSSTDTVRITDVTSAAGFDPGYGVSINTGSISRSVVRGLIRWLLGRFFGDFETTIIMGQCLKSCQTDGECRTGYRCLQVVSEGDKACIPFADGPGEIGDPCKLINDCSGGLRGYCMMERSGYPGGYCSVNCARSSCPDESRCVQLDHNTRACMHESACTEMGGACEWVDYGHHEVWKTPGWDECCETGRVCTPIRPCPIHLPVECSAHRDGQWGFCSPCLADRPCRDDYACYSPDGGTGVCHPSAKGSRGVGSPCTRLRDCAGGVNGMCLIEEETDEDVDPGWPGGYCTRGCSRSCPGSSTCVTLITGDRICLDNCRRSGGFLGFGGSYHCDREGYECHSFRTAWWRSRTRVCIAVPDLIYE